MRKRIILFTHIPTRDHITDQLLVQRLRQNHEVYVWSFLKDPREKVAFLKPHLIIVPEIRCEFARDFVRDVHAMGVQIVIRRGEKGHSKETEWHPEFNAAAFGNYAIYDYVDLDLVWGERFKQMLMKYHKQPEEKFAVVGGFFDHYMTHRLQKIEPSKDGRPRILFVGGFGYAAGDMEFCLPEALQGQEIHRLLVERDIRGQENFIRLMKIVLNAIDPHLIIRPHPGERYTRYQEEFGDRIEYCVKEPAIVTLNRVDAIVHSGSTMGYEAHLMGMPGFNYLNSCQDLPTGRIHKIYDNPYELCADLEKVDFSKSNAIKRNVKYFEKHYVGKPDGLASKRAVEAINSLPDIPEPKVPDIEEWPKIDNKQFNYESTGAIQAVGQWNCAMCRNTFFAPPERNLMKCPYCGVVCVKYPKWATEKRGPGDD